MGNLTIGVNAIGSSYAHAFVEIGSDDVTAPRSAHGADPGHSIMHAVTGRASWDLGAEAHGPASRMPPGRQIAGN
ncbi:MAG: hypothetical protein R3D56_13470 [Paracoccaceae bacterium]